MQTLSPVVSRGNESYNINSPNISPVIVVRNYLHTCVFATYSSCGYYSRAVFILLRAPDCAATIQGRQLFEAGVYLRAASTRGRCLFEGVTIRGWRLFEAGVYSRAVSIRRNTGMRSDCMLVTLTLVGLAINWGEPERAPH